MSDLFEELVQVAEDCKTAAAETKKAYRLVTIGRPSHEILEKAFDATRRANEVFADAREKVPPVVEAIKASTADPNVVSRCKSILSSFDNRMSEAIEAQFFEGLQKISAGVTVDPEKLEKAAILPEFIAGFFAGMMALPRLAEDLPFLIRYLRAKQMLVPSPLIQIASSGGTKSSGMAGSPIPATVQPAPPRAAEIRQDSAGGIDFVILTAIEIERRAVCEAFGLTDQHRVRRESRVYWQGELKLQKGGAYQLVVAQLADAANIDAAILATTALQQWRPKAALFVGIAGSGSKSVRLGDVVIAREVYYYERGKETGDGRKPEPKIVSVDATLFNNAASAPAWDSDILAKRPGPKARPRVHTGVVASGEKVIADAATRDGLASGHRKILAVEMEGYGFSLAIGQSFDHIRHMVIRGICDDASRTKDDRWHAYAAASAASFTRHFLADRPLEPASRGTAVA